MFIPKIFKDVHGRSWITGAGVFLYFRRIVPLYFFYDYDALMRGA